MFINVCEHAYMHSYESEKPTSLMKLQKGMGSLLVVRNEMLETLISGPTFMQGWYPFPYYLSFLSPVRGQAPI